MTKKLFANKGASIFEASFSLVYSIKVYAYASDLRTDKSVCFDSSDDEFTKIIEVAKSAKEVLIFESHRETMCFLNDDEAEGQLNALGKKFIGKKDVLKGFFIYSKSIDEIRALAKEIRSDRAVARATKKPAKPKADIKTRKDIL